MQPAPSPTPIVHLAELEAPISGICSGHRTSKTRGFLQRRGWNASATPCQLHLSAGTAADYDQDDYQQTWLCGAKVGRLAVLNEKRKGRRRHHNSILDDEG